eukprot:g11642.t1
MAQPRPSAPAKLEKRTSAIVADSSQELLTAIENDNVDNVRYVLDTLLKKRSWQEVLTEASLVAAHGQRTPLMAAAKRGDLAVFRAVLHRFDQHVPEHERDTQMRRQLVGMRDSAGMTLAMLAARGKDVTILSDVMKENRHCQVMEEVLLATDFENMSLLLHAARVGKAPVFRIVFEATEAALDSAKTVGPHLMRQSGNGMTILMHAARGGNAMALKAVVEAVRRICEPQTVRHLLYEKDANGMNFLMHSVACAQCQPPPRRVSVAGGDRGGLPPRGSANQLAAAPSSAGGGDNGDMFSRPSVNQLPPIGEQSSLELDKESSVGGMSDLGLGGEMVHPPDPAVPVFNISVEVVRECLWKGQVRDHFVATDHFGRNILTHSVRSKHCQLFEATLRAVRQDVLDPEVEGMLDTSSDNLDTTPLRSALVEAGEEMQSKFELARHRLKKQVSRKAKLSTVEAKIQSFIPGKLIVIFQLLLPVTKGRGQLHLLVAMCCLAPIFNWAASLLFIEKPVSDNPAEIPRKSLVSYLLGAPALFFWGVGTSHIGTTFGWSDSTSAASLAVATIVIPATDAFVNSKSVELWYEQWSCQKRRFVKQADRVWHRRSKDPLVKGFETMSVRRRDVDRNWLRRVAPQRDQQQEMRHAKSSSNLPTCHEEDEDVEGVA